MVIDNVGQVIGGQVVGALVKHLVVENVALDGHLAAQQVINHHVAARLNLEADHIFLAGVDKALHLLGGHCQRIAHLSARVCVILEIGYFGALCLKFLGSVEGDVGATAVKQHLDMLAVNVAALALLVGAERAAFAHTLVNLDSEPCEGFIDIILGSGDKTLRVGVLDAQNHRAAVLAGKQIII